MSKDSESAVRAFFDCWSRQDADGLAELFLPDADFVNVVGIWWRNARAIRKAHAYGFERIFPNAKLNIEDLKIRTLRPDIHIIHTVGTLTGQISPDGVETGMRRTVLSFVVACQDDGAWKIVSAQNTDRIEGADTHVAGSGTLTPASYRR